MFDRDLCEEFFAGCGRQLRMLPLPAPIWMDVPSAEAPAFAGMTE